MTSSFLLTNMRIIVHDYVGHAFPIQLSRQLAKNGHTVRHLHFPAFETPKGTLEKQEDDPEGLEICGVQLRSPYEKYSFIKRFFQEREYGALCNARISEFRPDIVLSNATPVTQAAIQRHCQKSGIKFITWVQDFHGIAIGALLAKKLGLLGRWAGMYFRHLDESVLRGADGIVLITEDFKGVPLMRDHAAKSHVIENWAPIEHLPAQPRRNEWSQRHELDNKFVFLYSGTLGLKHNPSLLLELASHFKGTPNVEVVVISQGLGRKWLEEQRAAKGLTNLKLLDFQRFEDLPNVVASGDVLIAIIEKDASVYCVPSKVLTYFCAARPLLIAMPGDNLAARNVIRSGAGRLVEPDDLRGFIASAEALMRDSEGLQDMARRGRAYAEETFDIRRIAGRFEAVFARALGQQPILDDEHARAGAK